MSSARLPKSDRGSTTPSGQTYTSVTLSSDSNSPGKDSTPLVSTEPDTSPVVTTSSTTGPSSDTSPTRAPTPVFSNEQENYDKEIEDRLYPIAKADIRHQLERIKARRKNPTHEEILKSLNLGPEDAHLLMAPAAIEDEDLWLQWFSDTLSKCGEARKANRDFRTNGPIARIGWADTNPYSVIDNSDPLETPSNNESDGEHDDIPPYHVASAHGPTPTFKTRNSPEGSHLPPPPFSWDDLPTEYPDLESSSIQEAKQKIRCQHNYH
ncbi:unnamed protein product [Aphanomyces euteiches]